MLGFFAFVLFSACNAQSDIKPGTKTFGQPVTKENAITYDQLIPKMKTIDSLAVKVSGKVSSVCLKKGCWMTLVPNQLGQPEMRITFKDYGFFMPKDIVGKTVVLDGFAYIETTPVEVLRHYAEDAGKTKEEIAAIKDPKRELSYEAAGVLIVE